MSGIKAILFDLDGVLVEAKSWHRDAFLKALRKFSNAQISKKWHDKNLCGLPTREKLKQLEGLGFIRGGFSKEIEALKQRYTKNLVKLNCVPNPLKTKMICSLKSDGFLIGCVTNCVRKNAKMLLRHSGLLELMDIVISNQDVTRPKPHPDPYILAMKKLNVKPHEVLIVEDNEKGFQSAKASGAFVMFEPDFCKIHYETVKEHLCRF